MYDSAKNLPLLASLMAKGVASVATGDAITGTTTLISAGVAVAKAFAPDITEHFISVLDYAQFKEFLLRTHPGDLNHDLDKLIKDSLQRAVGFIRRLYLDKLKDESELSRWQKFRNPFTEIDDTLAAMQRDLKAMLDDTTFQKSDLEAYLAGEHANCLDELTDYLFTVSGVAEQDTDWQELRAFFRAQLPLLFDLSYKEALKDEKNAKAFRAFEIWILEEGLANQKKLLAGQQHILAELAALRANQTPTAETSVLRQLDADVKAILALFAEKLNAMLMLLKSLLDGVNQANSGIEQANSGIAQANSGIKDIITTLEGGQLPQRKIPHQLTTVPAVGSEFVGRDKELEQLAKALAESRKVVLMNGLGGIGKTTLAKQFINQRLNQFDHVCWIDVTKQDTLVKGKQISGSIREALVDHMVLFANLNVPYNPTAETTDQRFQRIANALRQLPGRNLFVIDNAGADAGEKDVRNLLPQPPNWQVLLTSRQKLNGYQLVPLDKLDPNAAKALFDTYYTYDSDPDEVAELLASVDYHTLTVELFARTLEEHHGSLSVSELLNKVQRKALNDPDLQRRIETEHHPDETGIYLHLMLVFDCAELNSAEKTLLGQMALLPPEPYTVKDHLAPWLGYAEASQKRLLDETLTQLVKKGWLTQTSSTYALHRLIQQIVTYQIPFDWVAAQSLVESTINLLRTVDNPNALAVYPLRKYGEFLLACIPENDQNTPAIAHLQNNLALVYQDLGRYESAARLLEAALKSDQASFGLDHPTVTRSQSNLALVYKDLGHYESATRLLEAALKSDQDNFGLDHPIVAIRQTNLGLVYRDLGRYESAATLMEAALVSDMKNFGNDHPTTTTKQANLGLVYRDLGQYESAATLLEAALVSDIKNFDFDHPTVALRQSNLGLVYKDLGRYQLATRLLELALHSDEKNFGLDHPTVALRQSNLGLMYKNLGHYESAATLLESALRSDQSNFVSDHPIVARRQSNLATVYQTLGRYESAVELMESALQSAKKNFGADHPTVAARQSNLATVLLDMNRIEEAISLLQQAVHIFLLRLGKDHSSTKSCQSWLNNAIARRNR